MTIDTTAPVAPSIASFSTDSGTVGDGITNDNTLVLTGTAEANATVKVFDGANQLGSATANGSGAWSYTTAALANGTHSLTATATDAAGNVGAASSALSVTIDRTAPNVPVIVSDAIVNTNKVMLTGTAEANSKVTVFDGGDVARHGNRGRRWCMELYDQPTFGWAPRFYCDGLRCRGQYKSGFSNL